MTGRPREFDRGEALRRAMDVFWARGYERTQVEDLVEAMGIGRGSLYAAFGDKRALYLEALGAFIDRISAWMRGRLLDGPASPMKNLRAHIESWPSMNIEGENRGCFLTNSLIERGAHDPEVAALALKTLKAEELLYRGVLSDAQERGELDRAKDVGLIARSIVNARLGLTLQCRLGTIEAAGQAAARSVLALLE